MLPYFFPTLCFFLLTILHNSLLRLRDEGLLPSDESFANDAIQDLLRRTAAKPYSAIVDSAKAEAIPRDNFYFSSPQQMPSPISHSSTFGTNAN